MTPLPYALIGLRLLCAPAMLALAWFYPEQRHILVILLWIGVISDIFDGIIARHCGCQTEHLRRCDSQADTVFWLSALGSAALLDGPQLWGQRWAIALMLGMHLTCYLVSWLRFGKENCTHAFLSKLWALTLLVAFSYLLGAGETQPWFLVAVGMGVIAHLDVIAITLLLPSWQHDVPSSYHAWLSRRGVCYRKHKLLN
jgi:CDP-diacylglycerol---glycerol-3-phosphate 3-phosphatidyltransferase